MDIIELLLSEIRSFLGINEALKIIQSGDYSAFLTFDGIKFAIYPLIPFLLIFEFWYFAYDL